MAFISKKIEDLINLRIFEEEQSSRIYLAMAKWLSFNGYAGASKLWAKYASEENNHSGWAYTYLEDLDILPKVPALEAPKCEFKGLEDICKQSYDHEIMVTKSCNELAKAAAAEGDYMTVELAQRYLKEQAEEIGKTTYWLDRIEAFGNSPESLRLLDDEMGEA
jgi:ferritin